LNDCNNNIDRQGLKEVLTLYHLQEINLGENSTLQLE
jgi:hypothetical protein